MCNHGISDSVRVANCYSDVPASIYSFKRFTISLVFAQITAAPLRAGLGSLTAVPNVRTFPLSFWLHCKPRSAYFGPTNPGLDIYNPRAYKFLADVCLHCVPSAEVLQINGLNCDKLYTANVFEKSRTPKRFFLLIFVTFLSCV